TREIGMAQVRAYITISKVEVYQHEGSDYANLSFCIKIANNGQSPAWRVRIYPVGIVQMGEGQVFPRRANLPDWAYEVTAGEERELLARCEIRVARLKRSADNRAQITNVWLVANLVYSDAFGVKNKSRIALFGAIRRSGVLGITEMNHTNVYPRPKPNDDQG